MLCPHLYVFTFVKNMCHIASSNASNACVKTCLMELNSFMFVKAMHHDAREGTSDVHTHVFLCSSKACVIVQAVTNVCLTGIERGW